MAYRERRSPRDSTRGTARGVLLMVWVADDPLSQEITIYCQSGADVTYRKRRSPRDSTRGTARGVLLMAWVAGDPLSQEITIYCQSGADGA